MIIALLRLVWLLMIIYNNSNDNNNNNNNNRCRTSQPTHTPIVPHCKSFAIIMLTIRQYVISKKDVVGVSRIPGTCFPPSNVYVLCFKSPTNKRYSIITRKQKKKTTTRTYSNCSGILIFCVCSSSDNVRHELQFWSLGNIPSRREWSSRTGGLYSLWHTRYTMVNPFLVY